MSGRLVRLRALDQRWQLNWHDEQNDIGLTSFVDVVQQNCRQNASVGPTNDFYQG